MARIDFVKHRPGSRYLRIHEDYLTILDGDFCAAALLAVFEFWSGCEWNRICKRGGVEQPWIELTVAELYTEVMGMYSMRSIQEGIKVLQDRNLLVVERGSGGNVNRYLLNLKLLNESIEADGKISVMGVTEQENCGWSYGKTDGKIAVSIRDKVLTVEERSKEQQEGSHESSSTVDFQFLIWRWKDHKGFKAPNKADRLRAETRWAGIEPLSEEQLKSALDYYYDSEWGRKNGYPIMGFLKDPLSWSKSASPPEEPEVFVERRNGSPPPQPPTTSAPTDIPPSIIPLGEGGMPLPVEIWNQIVTSGPRVQAWDDSNHYHRYLRDAWADERFRDNLGKFCATIQAIIEARDSEVSWLTFLWLIKPESPVIKTPNWWKLHSGQMDSMAKPSQPKQQTFKSAGAKATENALRILKERAK